MPPEDVQKYLYQPIVHETPQSDTKEARLRTIIKNIDRQHALIRAAIIKDAKQILTEMQSSQRDIDDAMEIDSDVNSGETYESEQDKAASDLLYGNLNAPWNEAEGDPCVKRESATNEQDAADRQKDVLQAKPPIELIIAKQTLDRLTEYERTSCQASFGRDYYVRALRRHSGPGDTERGTTTHRVPETRRPDVPDTTQPRRNGSIGGLPRTSSYDQRASTIPSASATGFNAPTANMTSSAGAATSVFAPPTGPCRANVPPRDAREVASRPPREEITRRVSASSKDPRLHRR